MKNKKSKSRYSRKLRVRMRLARVLGIDIDTPFPMFPKRWARSSDAPSRTWGG